MAGKLTTFGSRAGALICVRWWTEEQAVTGLTALKTYLARYGWRPSMVLWLPEPDSSFQLQATVVPYRSPYTREPSGHGHTPQALRNLAKCLQRFEIEADEGVVELHYQLALELAG